jgi:hypothetical protein
MAKTAKVPSKSVTKKAITEEKPKPQSPLRVGNTVFVRTVTHYYVGTIEFLDATEIVLSGASWVADTGRFNNALKTGQLGEIEPFIDLVSVSRGALVDATSWTHALPVEVK